MIRRKIMSNNHDTNQMQRTEPVVNIFNEWDPLEEIIVGILDGMVIPPYEPVMEGCMYDEIKPLFKNQAGKCWPTDEITAAQKDLDEFVHILEQEGVVVRRPSVIDFTKSISTPNWQISNGLGAANPRDSLLIIGNDIIETPMGWRSRYCECFAYRDLIKEYFKSGCGWVSAPKGELSDKVYKKDFTIPTGIEDMKYVITNFEPVFDAADFIKCGRDIFAGLSSTCNTFGIEWLQRYLDSRYGEGQFRIHKLIFNDLHPMHIDATFYPLAPGKLLIHPERVTSVPEMFKDWEILKAPQPCIPENHPLYFSSIWMNLNILMLDEKRVVVEKQEVFTIEAFKSWGFEVIPCNFRNFNSFGGSFHCATLDIRRKGMLKSYF